MGEALTLIVYFLVLFLLSAFFSASETALVGLSRASLRAKAKKSDRMAVLILELLKKPERTLSVILIGNNFVNVLLSSIATLVAVRFIGTYGVIYSTVLVTVCILLFSEITPKTVAAYYPDRVSRIVAIPLIILDRLLFPITWFTGMIAKAVAGFLGRKGGVPPGVLAEEVRELLYMGGADHDSHGFYLIHALLSFQEIRVENVMVPVGKVEFVDVDAPMKRIVDMFLHKGYLYVPAFKGSIDDVVGYLEVKEVVKRFLKGNRSISLKKFLKDPVFVPEVAPAIHALELLLKKDLAVVFAVDEFGGISGVVFLENILRELSGRKGAPKIIRLPDGSVLADSSVSMGDIGEVLGVALPADVLTKNISSVVLEEAGDIPKRGERIRLYGLLEVEVVESTEKGLVRVLVRLV